ncbi:GNAT family N-acetyltransferase [Nonomuraea sp. H19]|uniref:GNAT family N-acetyltransferase n=1 Tax=Nonomuraea sp. H19 TaxID=3452206 RepID=UPI003F8B065F
MCERWHEDRRDRRCRGRRRVVGRCSSLCPSSQRTGDLPRPLVVDRCHAEQGVGRILLERAYAEAIERGIGPIRLDCWAGGDQRLIRYYERAGFVRTERFFLPKVLNGWEGQVLVRRVQTGLI